jgi:peptide deformylase
MVLKIVKYPDSILRKRCLSVKRISKEIIDLSDENQVGSQVQVFVLNTTPREDSPTPEVFINPKILDQEGAVIEEEGCLSFPELYLKITRYEKVRLHAKNLYNEDIIYESSGLLARAIGR